MYAITSNSYRSIGRAEDLQPGEQLVEIVPDHVLAAGYASWARSQRDVLLRASDWTQAEDSPLSEERKALWLTYRQVLRDLPSQVGFPNCQWPDEPE